MSLMAELGEAAPPGAAGGGGGGGGPRRYGGALFAPAPAPRSIMPPPPGHRHTYKNVYYILQSTNESSDSRLTESFIRLSMISR